MTNSMWCFRCQKLSPGRHTMRSIAQLRHRADPNATNAFGEDGWDGQTFTVCHRGSDGFLRHPDFQRSM